MKKNRVKGLLALGLSLTMMISTAGCGKEQQLNAEINPDTPVSEVQFPLKETEELSFITSAPATSTQDPNERVIFQRLEEQTNVHIDWTCFVSDQFSDKKNLALAQFGNLPDGLFNAGMSDYDLLRYAKQGIIIPLENLIDQYMPNLQAVFEKYPEYRTMCTAPDGHIYSFPWIEQLGAGKEAIQAIGDIPYINKKWLDYLGLEIPTTTDELEQVLIQFRDHAEELEKEFSIEGDVIPMSFIINNGDQDPAILINGFGEGYGDTGDHFAVTDEGKVIYTTVQEGYKEGIEWLHKLVTEDLVDPEAFTQEWSTYVAKGKNHRYGLCFTWDIANIDNNTDYVMLPALTGPDGMRNITRQNNSETSGFDRGRCVLTSSCRNTALAAAWIDQMYAPLQSPQNNWGTYGEEDSFNIFELSTNKDGGEMLKHMDLGEQSPVEVREAQSVNGPLAVLNEYYDVYVTQPEDAKWRLDNMHETYVQDMNSKYVYICGTSEYGYQSLHITFYDNSSRSYMEVQLRTQKMDDTAEIGPANHLGYEKRQQDERARRDVIPEGECVYFDEAYERGMKLLSLELADLDVNMFSAVNNSLINDGCGLFRGRLILPYEHLSRFQNDVID